MSLKGMTAIEFSEGTSVPAAPEGDSTAAFASDTGAKKRYPRFGMVSM
jgi:hypothetical protein